MNFRDLGGYPARDGKHVRWRQVYRSDSLHKLGSKVATYNALGIGAVVDLRRDHERREEPHPFPCLHVPLPTRRVDQDNAASLRERADGERWLFEEYCGMLADGGTMFGKIFALLAATPEPVVIHCTGGKDRTGLVSALLLTLLGVDRETILDDYELTSAYLGVEHVPEVVDLFVASGIGRPAAEGMLSTPRWTMVDALAVLDDQYGGIHAYLRTYGSLSLSTLEALTCRLLH